MPNATTVRPITRSETPIKRAILDAESTNQWAPKNNAIIERPMKIISDIMLLFYSSFLSLSHNTLIKLKNRAMNPTLIY